MTTKRQKLLLLAAATLVYGCSGTDAKVYEGTKPEITVKDFYSGPVHGYGIFQSPGGEVKDRYYATLVPSWNGNEGTIIEKQWNDKGELFFQQEWKIKVDADGKHFTATGTQIEGQVKGEAQGFALHMQYALKVPRDGGSTITLSSDDWTFLQPDGTGINKISMRKFGFRVGEVTYVLRKLAKGEKLHEGYVAK